MSKKYFCILLILIILLITSSISIAADPSLVKGPVIFNGHKYAIYNGFNSWNEAEKYAESIGGHLATITSDEENNFLADFTISSGYPSCYFGFTDRENEGNWKWVTGEAVTYTNWSPGQLCLG